MKKSCQLIGHFSRKKLTLAKLNAICIIGHFSCKENQKVSFGVYFSMIRAENDKSRK
jgi:hypothetical protein